MIQNSIELRRKRYFKLSSKIAQLENAQLRSLFDQSKSNESGTGWGMNHILLLEQSQIFVKHIPVTALEYDNLFSTRNFYNLPTSCSYGIRSPGFGVFRELVTHIKTTNWVLAGEIATFPLMYHYRIIPISGQRTTVALEHFGNHAGIRQYVSEKAIADHELVLFLEYIPHVLETWLRLNPHQFQLAFNDLRTTIDFLGTKGIIHFDAHFRNSLTDGEQTYLTDFGLVLDKSFRLTEEEASFFKQNTLYDYGEVLRNVGHLIRSPYESCSKDEKRRIMKKYGIKEDLKLYEVGAILLDHIKQIHADRDLNLDEFYVTSVVKYRSIIALMQDFFTEMWGNEKKDTKLPHAKLTLLLKETGLISDAE